MLAVFIYKVALSGGELGYGAAISFIMLLINLVIALFYLRLLAGERADERGPCVAGRSSRVVRHVSIAVAAVAFFACRCSGW